VFFATLGVAFVVNNGRSRASLGYLA